MDDYHKILVALAQNCPPDYTGVMFDPDIVITTPSIVTLSEALKARYPNLSIMVRRGIGWSRRMTCQTREEYFRYEEEHAATFVKNMDRHTA